MRIKSFAITALTALFALCSLGCGDKGVTVAKDPSNVEEITSTPATGETALPDFAFRITLYPEYAPITCENFEKLVSDGFYNGLTFHRVVPDFMAQGGDPAGTGAGGSKQQIKGEFSSNGVNNPLSHTRGVVSMARSSAPNSASSQFFICYSDKDTFLDGNYAAFGRVTEGMEIVDNFLQIPRKQGGDGAVSSPTKPIQIEKAYMISKDSEGHPRCEFVMKEFVAKEKLTTAKTAASTTTTTTAATTTAAAVTEISAETAASTGAESTVPAGTTTAAASSSAAETTSAAESTAAADTTTAAESTSAAASETAAASTSAVEIRGGLAETTTSAE